MSEPIIDSLEAVDVAHQYYGGKVCVLRLSQRRDCRLCRRCRCYIDAKISKPTTNETAIGFEVEIANFFSQVIKDRI
jgi:hypothetical protein